MAGDPEDLVRQVESILLEAHTVALLRREAPSLALRSHFAHDGHPSESKRPQIAVHSGLAARTGSRLAYPRSRKPARASAVSSASRSVRASSHASVTSPMR